MKDPYTEQMISMFEGFDWYQEKCNDTAIFPEDKAEEYLAMGLCSEAGEVAGKVKKKIRDGEPENYKEILSAELGDVFWYLAVLADRAGVSLGDLAYQNLNKLYQRKMKDTLKGSGDNR
jgi:NTP pyrophosphatase (non-canonical NTP hydrolase)